MKSHDFSRKAIDDAARAAFLNGLSRCVESAADKVPPDWRTVAEWAEIMGIRRRAVERRVKKMLATKAIERRVFKIAVGEKLIRVAHYRIASEITRAK